MAFDFVDSLVTVINNARDVEASGEINKQANDDMFNGLLATVPNFSPDQEPTARMEQWYAVLVLGEDAWCEQNYGDVKAQAQHQKGKRAGKWKYRTLLPNPYTSAKNVIGKAIERGVDVHGKGKSAINKESQEAKGEGSSVLAGAGKFSKLIEKAHELYMAAPKAVQDEMLESLLTIFKIS